MTDLLDAALALCDVILGESLRHPKHLVHLEPITADVQKVIADYFGHQKRALVHWVKYRIGEAAIREDKADRKATEILPSSLSPLSFAVTSAEASDFNDAIALAITRAGAQLAEELSLGIGVPETAMNRYLEQNSLSRLTGDMETTTTQRLRDAIADAVRSGGTADDIVAAIETTMDDFSTARAEMVAQTEVATAYNFGRHQLAESAGLNEKRWATESGNPCAVCLGNEGEDWIPMGQAFSSGDQFPTSHPRCMCSCDFRLVA
jgi:hypothetical protein